VTIGAANRLIEKATGAVLAKRRMLSRQLLPNPFPRIRKRDEKAKMQIGKIILRYWEALFVKIGFDS